MTRKNPYIKRFREFSEILNPSLRTSVGNLTVVENDINNLQNHLDLIAGSENEPGSYWDPVSSRWMDSHLPLLKDELKDLQKAFKGWQQTQLNQGNEPTDAWPEDLLDKRQKLEAQIEVREEEVAWLKKKIEALANAEVEESRPDFSVNPLRWPPGGKLRNNVLAVLNGQRCSLNEEGILFIDEPTSPYDKMLVWKFKSEILYPMGREWNYRLKVEAKAAATANRDKKKVPYPVAPKYDQKSDTVTYVNYHKDWRKNVKA